MNKFHLKDWKKIAFLAVFATGASSTAFAEEGDSAELIEEVVVTGSRIKTSAESDSNISIFTREEIEGMGVTSIGDFLQDIPQNVGGLNAQNNNGGNGSTQLSLRNLGSGRTLILLNGRRHVPYATGGTVDLNSIAPATIERIDVLLDGASTIYGADAVAGVVNFITRKDFNGVEMNLLTGASGEGDGEITDFDVTIGTFNDRGNISMTLGYYEMKEVMAGDRGWARQDLDYDWDTGEESGLGSSATPEGTIIDRLGLDGNAAWQAVLPNSASGVYWGPGGNNPSSTWSDFSFGGNSDVGEGSYYNYQPENYLYTPQERTNFFVTANYELMDNMNGFMELSYINRKSDQLLAPTPLFIISEGITIEAAQAQNPFGRDFIDVRRRMVEAGNRNFLQDIDTYRIVGGIELTAGDWDASVAYNFGRTDGTDTNSGRFIRSRVIEALSADCTAPCVPLNLFGGLGTITQDMVDWISYTGTAKTTYEQKSYLLDISNSSLFSLPAGDVGLAIGLEKREETGAFVEDPLTEAGDTTGNKGESTRGGYDVTEAYIELAVPVLNDSAVGELNVNFSSRYSDYSNFGDTTNSKVGFRWDVTDWIAFRGTYSEAFKAPSVASLFAGQADSFPAVSDPCSTVDGAGVYGSDATVTANCDADGLVGGVNDPNAQLRTRVGGNPNLGPETAETVQFGTILNPIEDLSVSVDYWKYEIENTIGSIGASTILGNCYFSADRKYCDKIRRDANGLITNIFAASTNIGAVETSGYDVQVSYAMDTDVGNFTFDLDWTIVDSYSISTPTATGVSVQECVNVYDCGTLIEHRWIFTTGWNYDNWNARLRVNYYDEFTECEGDFCGDPTTPSRTIDSVAYITLGMGYDFGQGTRLSLNVYNLTDENPPRIYNGFYSAADVAYDFLGQYFQVGISHTF